MPVKRHSKTPGQSLWRFENKVLLLKSTLLLNRFQRAEDEQEAGSSVALGLTHEHLCNYIFWKRELVSLPPWVTLAGK